MSEGQSSEGQSSEARGRPYRIGRALVLAVAVGVVAGMAMVSVAGLSLPAAQASPPVSILEPGSVRAVSDPGLTLTVPHDGRIRGYGFSALVTGVAFAPAAGVPLYHAPTGDHIVGFGLRLALLGTPDQTILTSPASPQATLVVGANRYPIDIASLVANGQATYIASVPIGSGVVVELSRSGLAQDYSLNALKRVGVIPTVAYRDPNNPTLDDAVNLTRNLNGTQLPENIPMTAQVNVASVSLGYFSPPGRLSTAPDIAGGAPGSGAYLTLSMSDNLGGPNGYYDGLFNPLATDRVTLVLPGGQKIPALHVAPSPPYPDLVGGTYYFSVPGDLTAASLVIDPGDLPVVDVEGRITSSSHVVFDGPVTYPISLPAVPALAPSGPKPIDYAVADPGSAALPTGGGPAPPNHDHAYLLALLIGTVVIFVAGAVVMRRRRPIYSAGPRTARGGAGPPATANNAALGVPVPIASIGLPPDDSGPGEDKATGTAPHGTPSPSATCPPGPIVLGAVAEALPPVQVNVLGPVEIIGLRRRIRRRPVADLLLYLALHPGRAWAGDELRAALWPVDSEASAASLHNYVSLLRGALPPGVLPEANRSAGYVLNDAVGTDWARFVALRDAARGVEGPDEVSLLGRALDLVRGPVLSGSAAALAWADMELARPEMEAAIEDVAHRLAEELMGTGDAVGAGKAASKGLTALAGSMLLHADRLRAAGSDPAGLDRAWKEARGALGPDAEELRPTYEALRRHGQDTN